MENNKVWVVKIDGLTVDNHFESLASAMEWIQVFSDSSSSILIETYIKSEVPMLGTRDTAD